MASLEPIESTRSEYDEIDARDLASSLDELSFSLLINSCNLDEVLKHNFTYSMSSEKPGKCLIFYHTAYSPKLNLDIRYDDDDIDPDAARLTKLFQELEFDTKKFKNCTYDQIMDILAEAVEIGFEKYSCFVCCFLTHGNRNGVLYAYDKEYNISDAWSHFCSDRCPTLVEKPKIFIVQACQGNDQNFGQKVSFIKHESTDSGDCENAGTPVEEYFEDFHCDGINDMPLIPAYSDFITAYATYKSFPSFRSPRGSYFIRELCEVLEKNYKNMDFVSILTRVNHKVAFNFRSKTKRPETNKLKQMPCFESSLTKLIKFS